MVISIKHIPKRKMFFILVFCIYQYGNNDSRLTNGFILHYYFHCVHNICTFDLKCTNHSNKIPDKLINIKYQSSIYLILYSNIILKYMYEIYYELFAE